MQIKVRQEIHLPEEGKPIMGTSWKFYADPSTIPEKVFSKWDVQKELEEKFGKEDMWKGFTRRVEERFEKIIPILEKGDIPDTWIVVNELVHVGCFIRRVFDE